MINLRIQGLLDALDLFRVTGNTTAHPFEALATLCLGLQGFRSVKKSVGYFLIIVFNPLAYFILTSNSVCTQPAWGHPSVLTVSPSSIPPPSQQSSVSSTHRLLLGYFILRQQIHQGDIIFDRKYSRNNNLYSFYLIPMLYMY